MCSDFCEWLFTANEMRQKRSLDLTLDWSGLNKTIEDALKTEDADSDGKSYRVKQLFNKHGYNLAILPGHVKGIREAFNPYAVLHLIPVGVGEVKIQGLESGLFLAMNPKGNLYAETDDSNEATIFLETSNGYYLNYLSKKYAHMGWHVGVTKQGRAKNGNKTWYPWGQKAIQFVARKAYDEPHPLRRMKNRHGCTLVIQNDGVVKGERNEENELSSASQGTAANKYAILEFIPTEPPGAFRIRGIVADLYLAMDSKGRLYGESDRTDGATIFAEHSQGQYYVYLSAKFAHHGWYIGLTKAGKAKKGHRTWYGQKAIQFQRQPIVPPVVTPNLGGGGPHQESSNIRLLQSEQESLTFIDEDQENGDLPERPTQVHTIKK